MGKIFGYARVSTQDQNLDLQIDALKKAGAAVIYKEKITGTKKERLELEQLLKAISEGDSIVVYKLDRISRSTKHLIELAETFEEKKSISFPYRIVLIHLQLWDVFSFEQWRVLLN